MGRASRKKKRGRKEAVRQIPVRAVPNWPLLGLALIGMALTAYLTVTYWRDQSLAGCPVGSGCDVVLSSRWSRLFGLPTSFWGFLAYGSLAGIAFLKHRDMHWKAAWTVSLLGVLYSLYLTAVSLVELDAACPYCLASLALMVAILGVVAYQRPDGLPAFTWRRWLVRTVPAASVAVLVLHLHFSGILGTPAPAEDPGVRALAEHLVKTNAKFYGAFWCPHCQDQKEVFGASADRLPYVECSPGGRNSSRAPACEEAGVRVYPTWIINGRSYEGVLSTHQLAGLSDFKASP